MEYAVTAPSAVASIAVLPRKLAAIGVVSVDTPAFEIVKGHVNIDKHVFGPI